MKRWIILMMPVLLLAACARQAPQEPASSLSLSTPDAYQTLGKSRRNNEPVPIAGGLQIPGGPLIHLFLPGPENLGLMGFNIEPSTITNFSGFSAMAYPGGTATDAAGKSYDLAVDLRVYQGECVSAGGSHFNGTFALI